MKKYLLTLVILFAPSIAFCQYRESETVMQRLDWDDQMLNIMLDMRTDAKFSTGNADGRELGFQVQCLKLWVSGEIIPGIRYRLRQRLNKSQTILRDNSAAATDHAWLAFDLGRKKQWTITAGKQSVQFGTFEYDYATGDLYLSTMCNSDLDNYKTGVNVAYTFGGQTFNLQVVNSDAAQFAREDYKNKALAVNFLWEGSLFDGALKTRWGYGAFQHTKSRFYNWFTPGIQVNIDKFTTELDYFLGERMMDYGQVISQSDLGLRFVRDQSISLNLKYNFGKWRPFIKGTWNKRHDRNAGETAYTNAGIQAVVEFYPFTHQLVKDLRFHLAYSYNDTDFKGPYNNLNNKDSHMLLAGVRWFFKAK